MFSFISLFLEAKKTFLESLGWLLRKSHWQGTEIFKIVHDESLLISELHGGKMGTQTKSGLLSKRRGRAIWLATSLSQRLLSQLLQISRHFTEYMHMCHFTPFTLILKKKNPQCWHGYGEDGIFIRCWWMCKWELLWKAVWQDIKSHIYTFGLKFWLPRMCHVERTQIIQTV